MVIKGQNVLHASCLKYHKKDIHLFLHATIWNVIFLGIRVFNEYFIYFTKFNQLSYIQHYSFFQVVFCMSSSQLITQHKECQLNNEITISCSTEISQAKLFGSLFFLLKSHFQRVSFKESFLRLFKSEKNFKIIIDLHVILRNNNTEIPCTLYPNSSMVAYCEIV